MISRWMNGLKRAAFRSPSRRERRLVCEVARHDAAVGRLANQIAALEEERKKLQSINRIQQAEIDELSAVVARNLERVKAETREISGGRLGIVRGSADDVRSES